MGQMLTRTRIQKRNKSEKLGPALIRTSKEYEFCKNKKK